MGSSSPPVAEDPLAGNYGEVPLPELQSKEEAVWEPYTEVDALAEGMKGRSVLVRGRGGGGSCGCGGARAGEGEGGRGKGYNLYKVRCVVTEREGSVSRQMVEFVASLTPGSIIDVRGLVTVPSSPIEGVSQRVEIQVNELYCISKPLPSLPLQS